MKLNSKFPSIVSLLTLPAMATAAEQPNVMMIVVDDWGVFDLSYNGSKLYQTRNVDALASESVNFSNAYVAYPRSVPSRYSLMTGMHCARAQVGAHSDDRKVKEDSYSIAMPFKEAGYSTFITGKWHLADDTTMPEDKGFDINIGAGKAGATGSHFAPFNKPGETNHDRIIKGMDDAKQGEYLTDYMSRKMAEYIRTVDKSKPFFAICSYYAVHTPLQAKADMVDSYKSKIKDMGLGVDPMQKQEAGVVKTQQDNAKYAAMVESVDQGIGTIIEALKESGEYDNTIIVLVSDHGGLSNRGENKRELATTNAPFKAGKGHLYEGGIRVPMFLHMPNQKGVIVVDEPVVNYDILPTLVDLCGLEIDEKAVIDGVSLKSAITQGDQSLIAERDLFWHKASERPTSTGDYLSSAVISGDYKLIDFYNQNRTELYNLKSDPYETTSIASEMPEKVKELQNRLDTWRKDLGVKMGGADSGHKKRGKGKQNAMKTPKVDSH